MSDDMNNLTIVMQIGEDPATVDINAIVKAVSDAGGTYKAMGFSDALTEVDSLKAELSAQKQRADALALTVAELRGVVTHVHESKEDFINSVKAILDNDPDERVYEIKDRIKELEKECVTAQTSLSAMKRQLMQNAGEYADKLDRLATEIETLKNPLRPINTAPMDGTQILIMTRAGFVYSASYDIDNDEWQLELGQTLMKKYAAHWMPLPDQPK